MTNELNQSGSFNNAFQGVDNSPINITQILGKSLEYKDLMNQLQTQQRLFARTPEDETQERLEISQEIARLTAQIEQFKADVTRLAAEFNRIEINTDRLRRAKAHFEQGEIAAARAVFDSEREQMQDENDRLVAEKERYEQDLLPKLKHSSDEFYLRALLERTAYDNPNWLADTCEYFERSINAQETSQNVFQYALFLQDHHQFAQAEMYYRKYLDNFAFDSPNRALALNNLGNLHREKKELCLAEEKYREALAIDRKFASENPTVYLPEVALTLNNLAILHCLKKEWDTAEGEYNESLAIRRKLAEVNPEAYLPYVAKTLSNLAGLHYEKGALSKSETAIVEALAIYRKVAQSAPLIYLPEVAAALNNLANVHREKNELTSAEAEYTTALDIRRKLATLNPFAYLPHLVNTLANLALYHLQSAPDRDRSVNYAIEAVTILQPMVEAVPYTQEYMQSAMTVLHRWGLSEQEIQQMLPDTST